MLEYNYAIDVFKSCESIHLSTVIHGVVFYKYTLMIITLATAVMGIIANTITMIIISNSIMAIPNHRSIKLSTIDGSN